MAKQLRPTDFVNYDDHQDDIKSKIFLYEERDPSDGEFEFNDEIYLLEDPTEINLPGAVTDPPKTIKRSLFNSYEWTHLKASFCHGWLFIYLDFIPGDDSETKQLKFKVYHLKKNGYKA